MVKFVLLAILTLFSACATEFTGGPNHRMAARLGFEVGDFLVVESSANEMINCWLLLDVYMKMEVVDGRENLVWASRKHDKTLYRLRPAKNIEWGRTRIVARSSYEGIDSVLKISKPYNQIHNPFLECAILK